MASGKAVGVGVGERDRGGKAVVRGQWGGALGLGGVESAVIWGGLTGRVGLEGFDTGGRIRYTESDQCVLMMP